MGKFLAWRWGELASNSSPVTDQVGGPSRSATPSAPAGPRTGRRVDPANRVATAHCLRATVTLWASSGKMNRSPKRCRCPKASRGVTFSRGRNRSKCRRLSGRLQGAKVPVAVSCH